MTANEELAQTISRLFPKIDAGYVEGLSDALAKELTSVQQKGVDPRKTSLTLTIVQPPWIAKEMRKLREAAGMTQQQVATELACSVSRIIQLEGGAVKHTLSSVRTFIQLYNVTDQQLIEQLHAEAKKKGRR